MSNPLFKALNGNTPQNGMMQQFRQFINQMQGKNPHQEINNLLSSGRINQQQLNQAQQMARQFSEMFKGFK